MKVIPFQMQSCSTRWRGSCTSVIHFFWKMKILVRWTKNRRSDVSDNGGLKGCLTSPRCQRRQHHSSPRHERRCFESTVELNYRCQTSTDRHKRMVTECNRKSDSIFLMSVNSSFDAMFCMYEAEKGTLTVRSLKSLAALGFSGGCFKDGCVVIPIPSLGKTRTDLLPRGRQKANPGPPTLRAHIVPFLLGTMLRSIATLLPLLGCIHVFIRDEYQFLTR